MMVVIDNNPSLTAMVVIANMSSLTALLWSSLCTHDKTENPSSDPPLALMQLAIVLFQLIT